MGRTGPALSVAVLLVMAGCPHAFGLNPSLDINQYAHSAWKIREGFATGTIQKIVQSGDGYLWLATVAGLLRFDGVRMVRWEPPLGEHLPTSNVRALVAGREGTLWIGTAKGLVSWKDGKLTHYPELDNYDVGRMLQDHEGTVWAAGVVWERGFSVPGKLCAFTDGAVQCYGSDGLFGFGVTALYEDSRDNLWLGAGNGIWRWRPGAPDHYMPPELNQVVHPGLDFPSGSLLESEDGSLLIGGRHGIKELADGKLRDYPLPVAALPLNNSASLLRDRNGALWIGTQDTGLLHVHYGRMDVFADSDGLSGNNVRNVFEDREGNIWVATTDGIDRFREYAIPTLSVKQGLSSPFVVCIMAAKDGSLWLGTSDGLNRWKEGRITIYRKPNGSASPQGVNGLRSATQPLPYAHEIVSSALPDNFISSLFQDHQGRIWISTLKGLAYFENDRLVRLKNVGVTSFTPITGDTAGNLWILNYSGGLYRLSGGRVIEHFPRAKLGIEGAYSGLVADPVDGGLWLASWSGGVVYFKNGEVRRSYGPGQGLGAGRVNSMQLGTDGALWAATEGGLSRIKNGHVITLAKRNGLPCDTAHNVLQDDAHSL